MPLERSLLSGNEAVALAAVDAGIDLGTGYPGTPSTEILEHFDRLGGRAQWSPNEKVALEVGLGVAFGRGRSLVTMKHVGLNVAADVLFTAAYSGVAGALVVAVADDPGLSSSQNEQDSRRYAQAAGVPCFEPADPQEAYAFLFAAVEVSEKFQLPVLFRLTTRVCHVRSGVTRSHAPLAKSQPRFERDPKHRVMIPAHARPAHRRLRQKLAEIAAWNETAPFHQLVPGSPELGIITSGVSFLHVREAAPQASVLKLGLTYPLPLERIRAFVQGVQRCVVVEEGDPVLYEALRVEGLNVEGRPANFRFGELNVTRVRRILDQDASAEPDPKPGKPPQLCVGCPHRQTFEILRKLDCIVAGDIGCYTLGVLPPFEAMDTQICMGASIGVGLGLRQVLPLDQARRVVSVIGDSTFVHSGITGLVEMVYNPPATGHVVIILDNQTTAMTGLQDHPASGRRLCGEPAAPVSLEGLAASLGVDHVFVKDPFKPSDQLEAAITEALRLNELTVIIVRKPCILSAKQRAETTLAETPVHGR